MKQFFPIRKVVLLVLRDIIVSSDDNLQLRVCHHERFRYLLVFGQPADHGDVAGLEDIGRW